MFWVNVRWLSPSAIQDRMSYSHTLWFIIVLLDDVKMYSNTGLDNTAGTCANKQTTINPPNKQHTITDSSIPVKTRLPYLITRQL